MSPRTPSCCPQHPALHPFTGHLLDGIRCGETGGDGPVAAGHSSSDNGREKTGPEFLQGYTQGTWGLEGFLEWETAQPRAAGCAGAGQVSWREEHVQGACMGLAWLGGRKPLSGQRERGGGLRPEGSITIGERAGGALSSPPESSISLSSLPTLITPSQHLGLGLTPLLPPRFWSVTKF